MGAVEDAALERANADQMARHGEPVEWTPQGGEPMPITAMMSYGEVLDGGRQGKPMVSTSAEAYVFESDAPNIGYQDTISVDAQTWTVAKVVGKSGGMWHVELMRDIRPTLKR